MRGVKTSDEARAKVIELYSSGASTAAAAAGAGVNRETAYGILREVGIDTSSKRRGPRAPGGRCVKWASRENASEIDSAIRAEYPHLGPIPLAERFGLTKGIISKRAWALGVTCETAVSRRKTTFAARNESITPGYFETWSPNMAWLLGYIWADGNVYDQTGTHKIRFLCAVRDEHIIHDIHAELRCTATIQYGASRAVGEKYQGQPSVGFSVSSISAVRTLIERHGIKPNKSNIDPPMPEVPDEYMRHFARGAIDGDGSLAWSGGKGRLNVVLYGSHRYVESMRHRISQCSGARLPTRLLKQSSSKMSAIRWGGAEDVTTLVQWLYPEGTYLHLRRKKERAEIYLSRPPARRWPGSRWAKFARPE